MNLLSRAKLYINRKTRSSHALPQGVYANALPIPAPGDDGNAPEWIRIVPIGQFLDSGYGAHVVTAEHIQQMAANFAATDTDLLFDLDHDSFFTGSTRSVGWAGAVEARDDGLYVSYPEWTDYGQQLIASREYRYLSPVYALESTDRQGQPTGAELVSVGLTNLPYFRLGEIDAIGNSRTPTDEPGQGDTDMKLTDAQRKKLASKYGLADTATDEEIAAAIEADQQQDPPADPPTDPPADPAKPADPATPPGPDGAPLDEARVETVVNRVLASRDQAGRAEALVNQAVADFKILPADKDLYLNSAKANFDATKTRLDAIKPNTVKPGGVHVNRQSAQPGSRIAGSVSPAALKYVNEQYTA